VVVVDHIRRGATVAACEVRGCLRAPGFLGII
jgi:hypothetical protein